MKKIILPCIISFIIMTIGNYSFAVSATVNATAVRIRETASTDSNIITNIYKDDEVEILEEAGDWYKVKYGESTGYAKAEFFTKKGETTNNIVSNNTVENTVNNANLVEPIPVEDNTYETEQGTENIVQEHIIGDIITLQTSVKIRTIPSLTALAKSEIAQGATVTIDAKLGNWYKISSEEISGWIIKTKFKQVLISSDETEVVTPEPISTEQEKTEVSETESSSENTVTEEKVEEQIENVTSTETTNKTAIVIVETARVREKASKTSEVIEMLDEDEIVTIVGEEGEFYKITSEKVKTGYISKSLVKEKNVTSRSMNEERDKLVSAEANEILNQSLVQATNSVNGNDIVEFAKKYLGYPYVLGCSTPENGFDCSGFTRYVYGNFGYKLGQVAADQTSLGAVIEKGDLQTGDLILFYNDGKTKIGHCGIYIEGGDFIHSANPQRGVVIDNLNTNSYYSQRFVTARRII